MPTDIRGLAPLLEVLDMPASVHFYCDVLGFQVVSTSQPGDHFGWALLALNGVQLMLNTVYEDGARPPVAAHADTTLFFGCPALYGAYRHLRAHGFNVEEPVTRHYGMRQLSVMDPDGYNLCFQWPANQTAAPS